MSKKVNVERANWKHGIVSVALITYDDFCPEYSRWYDSGGNMGKSGVIERVVVGELHRDFPRAKFFFFTVPNMRYRWVSFKEFEVVKPGTYLLSRHPKWVAWVRDKIRKNNFYLGYHGWTHTGVLGEKDKAGTIRSHDYCSEFKDRCRKDTLQSIEKMMREFEKVDLPVEKAFVPAAGGISDYLLDLLAEKDVFYAYNLENVGIGYPEYYKTKQGRKMLNLQRKSAWVPEDVGKGYEENVIDGLVAENKPLFFSNHFNNNRGVRDGITSNNVRCLKNALRYVEDTYGEKVQYASYMEIRRQFEEQSRLRFTSRESGGVLTIRAQNPKGELKGASFEVKGTYKDVVVVDQTGERMPTMESRNGKECRYVIVYPDMPFSIASDGYILLKSTAGNSVKLYTDGSRNIILKRDGKIQHVKVNRDKTCITVAWK